MTHATQTVYFMVDPTRSKSKVSLQALTLPRAQNGWAVPTSRSQRAFTDVICSYSSTRLKITDRISSIHNYMWIIVCTVIRR